MIVSVTRLRLRSWRFLLPFAWDARQARLQAERSAGCRGALVRKTQGLAFWTLTYWDDEASLRQFMLKGPHRKAMPKLAKWCDESAVTHWQHDAAELPGWDIATARLAEHGRLSRVDHPSDLQRSGRIGVS
jgi:Domain of unknown function (DUF3291)